MNPDSTLAVTNTCPKDGVHLCLWILRFFAAAPYGVFDALLL